MVQLVRALALMGLASLIIIQRDVDGSLLVNGHKALAFVTLTLVAAAVAIVARPLIKES